MVTRGTCRIILLGLLTLFVAGRLVASAGAPAAAENPLEIVSQLGGYAQALAVEGDRAYLVAGSQVVVFEMSDPGSPVEVGRTKPLARRPTDIAADGQLVFLSLRRNGLQIIDMAEPHRPTLVSRVEDTPSWPHSVAVSGGLACVLGYETGGGADLLQCYDVADPAAPTPLGRIGGLGLWPGVPRAMSITDEVAYIVADAGVVRVGLADPRRLRRLSTLTWDYWSVRGLAVVDSMGYVGGGVRPTPPAAQRQGCDTPGPGDGGDTATGGSATIMRIVDLQRTGSWDEVGRVEPAGDEWGGEVTSAGGTAYMSIQTVRDPRWVLRAYDVADPGKVRALGEVGMPVRLKMLQLLGRRREFVGGVTDAGVAVYDMRDPSAPRAAHTISVPGWRIRGIAVLGSSAYIADDRHGLRIVDASDPALPQEVGGAVLSAGLLDVAVEDREPAGGAGGETRRLAYGVSRRSLIVLDVTDPSATRELASVELPGSGVAVEMSGDHAYVAATNSGLQIVDVADPSSPRLAGSIVIEGEGRPAPSASLVAIEGDYAFVVYRSQKLMQVVDVSDPNLPREVGRPPERIGNVEPADIAVADGFVYIPGASSGSRPGLEVYDVRDPMQPRQVGFLQGDSDFNAVAVAGNRAYVTGGVPALKLVDIADPMTPRVLAAIDVPGEHFRLAASGVSLFVADLDSSWPHDTGLTIVRHAPDGPQASATPPDATPSPPATDPNPTGTPHRVFLPLLLSTYDHGDLAAPPEVADDLMFVLTPDRRVLPFGEEPEFSATVVNGSGVNVR